MVLWLDLHRPKRLDGLDLHDDINNQLRKLVRSGDIPHLLFYGPPGAGKKTRINAFLSELFGPTVEKARIQQRVVETSSKKIEISSLASPYHIEINPSDAGNHDTAVVQEVIKELAQFRSVSAKAGVNMKMLQNKENNDAMMSDALADGTALPAIVPQYKVVVLHEVDKLSVDAQHGLRRTMEQYTRTCRLILCSESATKVTAPLKSRCFLIRVPSPQDIEILRVCKAVLDKEKKKLSQEVLQNIVEMANGNLRRALLALETTCLQQHNLGERQQLVVKVPDWEGFITAIADHIVQSQSPQQLLTIRNLLYQLLTSCIPPDLILQRLTLALTQKVSNQAGHSIQRWAAYYDERLNNTTKSVIHLEAFVAKCMAVLVYDIQLTKL